ncbi:MAG: alpha-amylase [Elusimicrobia bacterium]|nr:alpha-amylase [Elusimicrobiota bacterium]
MRTSALLLAGLLTVGARAQAASNLPHDVGSIRPEQRRSDVRDASLLQAGSPDWRDQIVYFLMTDRFSDGNPANDDQGHGEYKPQDPNAYSGGDMKGILQKLDYIQALGATAVWLTPPVANVWYDSTLKMSGYHGYWTENFKRIDKHLGAVEDYRRLSMDLHKRGMFLIQDIVANHIGDFFNYEGPYDPAQPEKGFRLKKGIFPPGPSQHPFSLNDASDPKQRQAAIYHWTPDISDYKDDRQRLNYQMSGLDDLNTSNPLVRETLRASYDFWIATAGVDGFRIDTAHFAEHEFWRDFIHSASSAAPGVEVYARSLGKKDFMTFGEVWVNSEPFADQGEQAAASYLGTEQEPEMRAVLNFPLAMDLRAVFAKGAPPARLAYRLETLKRLFRGGRASVNFVDNHDMARFLSEGSEAAFLQALTALLTLPGLPVIYAGSEQGFLETRGSMFAAGFGSGGKDHFDDAHPLFWAIHTLAAVRKRNAVFRRGELTPLYGAAAASGPLAYRMDVSNFPDDVGSIRPNLRRLESLDGEGEQALVVMNTADEEVLLADIETGIPGGSLLDALFLRGFTERRFQIGKGGKLTLPLPARGILVLKASGKTAPVAAPKAALSVDPLTGPFTGPVAVSGRAAGTQELLIVIDGRVTRAIQTRVGPDGRWQASFDAADLSDGEHSLLALAKTDTGLAASQAQVFTVAVPFTLSASAEDPAGDDKGPSGAYLYPLAAGFKGRADIAKLSLYRRGRGAKLVLQMAEPLSNGWNPALGFDHVCFDVYISFPGRRGSKVLPRLNAPAPAGFEWSFAAFLGGWKAALYSAEGASASAFGPQVQPAPKVTADKDAKTVEVLFDLDAFKGIPSFDGARFYVTTWDYDGMEGTLRPLAPAPADYAFGGGKPKEPRIMDDVKPFP